MPISAPGSLPVSKYVPRIGLWCRWPAGLGTLEDGGQMWDQTESVDAGSQEWVRSGLYDHYL